MIMLDRGTHNHVISSKNFFQCILIQKRPNGYFGSMIYFNQATTDCEKNYHSFELGTLAIAKD